MIAIKGLHSSGFKGYPYLILAQDAERGQFDFTEDDAKTRIPEQNR